MLQQKVCLQTHGHIALFEIGLLFCSPSAACMGLQYVSIWAGYSVFTLMHYEFSMFSLEQKFWALLRSSDRSVFLAQRARVLIWTHQVKRQCANTVGARDKPDHFVSMRLAGCGPM